MTLKNDSRKAVPKLLLPPNSNTIPMPIPKIRVYRRKVLNSWFLKMVNDFQLNESRSREKLQPESSMKTPTTTCE